MKYALISLATIMLIGFLLTKFFFSPAVVEGESMMPTLTSSDYVLLNKFDLNVTRFEVVAFKSPDAPQKDYIKRVIGMPGDTIEVKDDVLFINGKAQDESYLDQEREELQDGEKLMKDFTLKELTGASTVPPNKLFVMGDNRLYSRDSRDFGFIDQKDIKGRANLIIWPFSRVNQLK
ncbi:signal peptidase I [Isobaculum melis]|uniref:Signal peptidase I n=1 Tax=Isobaculum melis TaxID=142588 RepID=A0A1H9UFD5_9LACT|nr:signal peptidase I [Isobaculum melis]SES08166.1 type I signal peptidase. Serine peptidase. MEROPS family S26A [Isobaculum melis]